MIKIESKYLTILFILLVLISCVVPLVFFENISYKIYLEIPLNPNNNAVVLMFLGVFDKCASTNTLSIVASYSS